MSLLEAGQLAALELIDSAKGGFVSFVQNVRLLEPDATAAECQSLYDQFVGRPSSPPTHNPATGVPQHAPPRYVVEPTLPRFSGARAAKRSK